MKGENSLFQSELDTSSLQRLIRASFGRVKFESVDGSDFDHVPTASFLAVKNGLIEAEQAAVQVYLYDEGDHRVVEFAAMGSGILGRAMYGVNTMKLSVSRKMVSKVVTAMHQQDPTFQRIG